ncbi:hypothetical protein P3771_31855 [Pseudomonas aeruginosa]|nr:hypothetical protein [Pseudomonas aeruginosa]
MMAVRVAVVMVAATVALAGAVMATVEPVVVARPVLTVMVAVRVVVATAQGRAVVPVAGRACKVAVRTIAARS